MMKKAAVAVFVKAPVPGHVKTRLARPLGLQQGLSRTHHGDRFCNVIPRLRLQLRLLIQQRIPQSP